MFSELQKNKEYLDFILPFRKEFLILLEDIITILMEKNSDINEYFQKEIESKGIISCKKYFSILEKFGLIKLEKHIPNPLDKTNIHIITTYIASSVSKKDYEYIKNY